jgi:hypothetical protein
MESTVPSSLARCANSSRGSGIGSIFTSSVFPKEWVSKALLPRYWCSFSKKIDNYGHAVGVEMV